MEANAYVYAPDGTSVDLYVEYDKNLDIIYYKVITVWNETGHDTIDQAIYDFSWMTFEYLNELAQSA
jgi:hypothetical protein